MANRPTETHKKEAERLLDLADDFRPGQSHYHGLMLRASVHATLAGVEGRTAPKKAATRKTTTPARKATGAKEEKR